MAANEPAPVETLPDEPSDDRVLHSLYARAIGYSYAEKKAFKIKTGPHQERIEMVEVQHHIPPDINACLQWLKHRCPHDWSDRAGAKSGDGNTILAHITIDQVMGRLQKLDDAC